MAADARQREIFGGQVATRNRRAAGLGATMCALALLVPLVWTVGVMPVDMPFTDGTAWLSNGTTGEVVQVNGATGQVQAALDVGEVDRVSITQSDRVVVVEVDGELRAIDLSLLQWRGNTPADGDLVVGEDDDGDPMLYKVEASGRVTWLDPLSLAVRGEVNLAGTPSAGVVAQSGTAPAGGSTVGVVAQGKLHVPVSTEDSSRVQVIERDEVVEDVDAGARGDELRVSHVGDEVVVVNLTAGTVGRIDPTSPGSGLSPLVDVDIPDGAILLPAEMPAGHLWLASVRDGELLAIDLDSGATVGRVDVAAPRSTLAGPVVLDDKVYIIDRDTGTLVLVDSTSATELRRDDLADYGIEGPEDVELLVQGGRVFLNDPDSHVAVVFERSGTARQVDKYASGGLTPISSSDFTSSPRGPGRDGGRETERGPVADESPDDRRDEQDRPQPDDAPPARDGSPEDTEATPAEPDAGRPSPGPDSPPDGSDHPDDPDDLDGQTSTTSTTSTSTTSSTTTTSTSTTTSSTTTSTTIRPPGVPVVDAYGSDGRIDIVWTPVPGAVNYQVNTGSGWATAMDETSHYCWEPTDQHYTVQVRPLFADGTHGESGVTEAYTDPDVPHPDYPPPPGGWPNRAGGAGGGDLAAGPTGPSAGIPVSSAGVPAATGAVAPAAMLSLSLLGATTAASLAWAFGRKPRPLSSSD